MAGQTDRLSVHSLAMLARAIGGKCSPECGGIVFSGVSIDSRTVRTGQLFWALRGSRHDGHEFVAEANEKGAVAAVVERGCAPAGIPSVAVTDTGAALVEAARWYRQCLAAHVIAVTGSAGKTTTREMLRCVLAPRHMVHAAEKSHNNHIGVPLTVLNAPRETELLILELGTSGPGEIADLAHITAPEIGIVTAIGPAHLDGLRDLTGVAREKLSLLFHCRPDGTVFVNADSLVDAGVSCRLPDYAVTYSLRASNRVARVQARWISDPVAPRLVLGRCVYRLPAPGRPLAYAALASILVAREFGLSRRSIQESLDQFVPVEGRGRLLWIGKWLVLDDTYNANPLSVEACAETLSALARAKGWPAVLVLGDLLELGPRADCWLRRLGERIGCLVDAIIACGPLAEQVADGAAESCGTPVIRVDCHETAAARLRQCFSGPAVIAVKGSRAARMDELVAMLQRAPVQPSQAA